jgi:hypothetical protein
VFDYVNTRVLADALDIHQTGALPMLARARVRVGARVRVTVCAELIYNRASRAEMRKAFARKFCTPRFVTFPLIFY